MELLALLYGTGWFFNWFRPKVLSIRLHSKSHQKSFKCQSLLTDWYVELIGWNHLKKAPCIMWALIIHSLFWQKCTKWFNRWLVLWTVQSVLNFHGSSQFLFARMVTLFAKLAAAMSWCTAQSAGDYSYYSFVSFMTFIQGPWASRGVFVGWNTDPDCAA